MKRALAPAILAGCMCAAAQQHVLLDFSGSMRGFANKENARLTGMLQRLGHGLGASGPVAFHAFHTAGGSNAFSDLTLNDAAVRFTDPNNYGGNSPLIWSVNQAAHRPGAREIAVFTDGMEDDAKLDDVASAFVRLARDGWGIGLAEFLLPFDGTYFAEMRIPLDEFFPKIAESVKQANLGWVVTRKGKVEEQKCEASNSACYGFKGSRPMLVILLSKGRGVASLFSALDDAGAQVLLKTNGKVRIAPAGAYTPSLRVDMKAGPRQALKPPKPIDMVKDPVKAEFSCLESGSDPLPLTMLISSSSEEPDDATFGKPTGMRIVGNAPPWVSHVGANLSQQGDGSVRHDLAFVCKSPGIASIFSPSAALTGVLQIEYAFQRAARPQGWWVDLSAENPWQYPQKVYRLKDVVNRVQEMLIQNEAPRKFQVAITLKPAS